MITIVVILAAITALVGIDTDNGSTT